MSVNVQKGKAANAVKEEQKAKPAPVVEIKKAETDDERMYRILAEA